MEANIKDVLIVVMQQRNDALNKVAELTAQNIVMQKKLKALNLQKRQRKSR